MCIQMALNSISWNYYEAKVLKGRQLRQREVYWKVVFFTLKSYHYVA